MMDDAALDVARTNAGVLDLKLARIEGVTKVVRHYQQAPLYTFHPLYVDPSWPGMAFIYMLQGGEGVVQGDRYQVHLDCGSGTAVHFTTQSAQKIFRTERRAAIHFTNVEVGAGAFVEVLPDPVIPFRGSRFHQRTRMVVDPTATVIFGETLLPGRVARGEVHAYELYEAETEVHATDGTLLLADRLELRPGSESVRSLAKLGPHDVLATLHVVTRQPSSSTLVPRLRGVLAEHRAIAGGVSELPHGSGVIVRALGPTSTAMAAAMRALWNEARVVLKGVPAPDLRKL